LAITASHLQTQSYEFQQDTPNGRWKWTTVVDVSGSSPAFNVARILSPRGIMRDSIPIPGDVVVAMGESIAELRTQFTPAILLGPPIALTFDVDEGRGFSLAQEVALTNSGVFGSLLATSLTASAAYVSVVPARLGGLSANEAGTFEVSVDSTSLLAVDSPYAAAVLVEDPMATNTPRTLPVTINVRPRATIEVGPGLLTFAAVKPLSGPFATVPLQAFVIANTGPVGSVLEWQLQRVECASWLASFGPVSGTLEAGETETINVVVAPTASTLQGAWFTETLRISGFSTNAHVDVGLQLRIT
jgi:hypothetical protein